MICSRARALDILRCVLVIFVSSSASLVVAEDGAKVKAKRVAFHSRLEAAEGEYRLSQGKGRMCSEGALRVLDSDALVFGLGSNIIIRDVDAGEQSYPQDDGCEIRSKTVSSGSKLTLTTRYLCSGQPERKTVATIRFSKNRIEYEDVHSVCVFTSSERKGE